MTDEVKQFPLRLERSVFDWVASKARKNDRSVNAEMGRMLRQLKEKDGQTSNDDSEEKQ